MNIAILYQLSEPPSMDGIRKPMKKGGYSDSGADVAFEMRKNGRNVILPVAEPDERNDLDWVFGDDARGIERAIEMGADTLWLNTVLYDGHPIEKYLEGNIRIIGQHPHDVQVYDDKYRTNKLLLARGLPVAEPMLIRAAEEYHGAYPCVIKPVRGRGSQGVRVVYDFAQLSRAAAELAEARIYGTVFMVEPFLTGEEITVAVFPADEHHDRPYCLPPVVRFAHIDGIAPYNGTVAVTQNSRAVDGGKGYEEILDSCSRAYDLLGLRAPIRIDCRRDGEGRFLMFDINMKPNMTLGSRAHRCEQDSLVMIAARRAGLPRIGLIEAYIKTAWK